MCNYSETLKQRAFVPLAEKAIADEDYKDVAYFEPFYLKEFVASMPKKLL